MSMRAALLLVAALLSAGCARTALLRVDPAALGAPRTLQQRVQFSRGGREQVLDLAVEWDDRSLRVVGSAFAVRVLALRYDGRRLQTEAASGLPRGLSPAQVINDLLVVYAPAAALREALGPDWELQEARGSRTLSHRGRRLIEVRRAEPDPGNGRSTLDHRGLDYRLVIDSASPP